MRVPLCLRTELLRGTSKIEDGEWDEGAHESTSFALFPTLQDTRAVLVEVVRQARTGELTCTFALRCSAGIAEYVPSQFMSSSHFFLRL